MISENRTEVRYEFAALIGAAIPDATLFTGQVTDFDGRTPVIVVSSGGSNHEQVSRGIYSHAHHIDVFLFVLYKDERSGWDELDAENMLDDLENRVFQVVADNQVTAYWNGITYRGESTATPAPNKIGGAEYKVEVIQLSFS